HNHPEGIRGAQATAAAVFLAKAGATKSAMVELLTSVFAYDLRVPYEVLQPDYRFSELAQDTVPAAIMAFLAATDFEDALRKAMGLGGDASTLAAITGGIAEAFYHRVRPGLRQPIWGQLDESQQDLLLDFKAEFAADITLAIAA
ncbi:MAG: ADP-ribosylglycohydrolase family protein, partial [Pseudomonadota bacterium]